MFKNLAIGLGFLLGVAFALFALTAPRGEDPEQFAVLVNEYSVRIVRDAYGVPHIFGKRDVDVAFGLAYAHAQDDFSTIQDVLLATRGKLATLHGVDAAKTDYLVAFMGVWDAVDAGYGTLVSTEARAHAEAYADGLNYYASQNPGEIAAALLPVTGKDVVAGFTFKMPLFYGFDQAVAKVVDGTYGTGLNRETNLEVTAQPQPEIGSQGIAIAPSRTHDGSTLLLVNSHQPLTGPVAWYEARVKSEEGWDMAGGTFPGSPVILHGHGPDLGWANTVNKPDLIDVYELTLNPDNESQYLLDGEWRDFEVFDAEIDITFLWPFRWTVKEPVYRSAHGPVFKTEKGALALRWAGMGEVRSLDAMIAMNKAQTMDQFEAAFEMGVIPSLNYVYADRDGNIAHYYNAMMPDRRGEVDWMGILPGDRSDLIWKGYHPFTSTPKTVNPTSGAVYNANNTPFQSTDGVGAPTAEMFLPSMGIESHMTNRALRLKELLPAAETFYDKTLRYIKYDNAYSFELDEKSVAFMAYHEMTSLRGDLKEAATHLFGWNLATDSSSTHAALGVLSVYPFIMADMRGEPAPDPEESLRAASEFLMKHYGRLDPKYGEVMRLVRGDTSWPISGGPDTLRAVYGELDESTGTMKMTAGDSYIMFVRWDKDGSVSAQSIHSFGSATLDKASAHYADQAPTFVREKERVLPLTLETVLLEKTSDITLGIKVP